MDERIEFYKSAAYVYGLITESKLSTIFCLFISKMIKLIKWLHEFVRYIRYLNSLGVLQ